MTGNPPMGFDSGSVLADNRKAHARLAGADPSR